MRLRRRKLLALAALAAFARQSGAATALPWPRVASAAAGFSAARLRALEAFLDADTRAAAGTPGHLGAVALLLRRGQLVHWSAHGQRDLPRREPMPPDAIFRIYSMTKPLAAVALLMLMEEGRLGLDDAVSRHLPEFAGQRVMVGGTGESPQLRAPARAVTLRHLLTHTAGLATRASDAPWPLMQGAAPQAASDLAGFARRVASVPLAAEPGTRFQYDGVNTEVACRVVEVVAGEPFAGFLQRRLLDPLEMTDTGFVVPEGQRHRIADLSAVDAEGRLVLADHRAARTPGVPLNDYASGAGGLYATAPDYARFAQMLLDEGRWQGRRLLAASSVALMRTNQLAHLDPIAGLSPGEGYGLGVSVLVDPARRGRLGTVGAYGWSGAATTYFTVDPTHRMIALLLMQHLPHDGRAGEPAKPSVPFHQLVYQALER